MQEGALCTGRAHDQADDGAGDHALRLGASGGGAVTVRKVFLNLWDVPETNLMVRILGMHTSEAPEGGRLK
jgi:hypothetical protein